jgi:hypothetical protein
MKIATFIFTFYMLALSLIPCGDGGGGIVKIANHLFGIEHERHSDHEQHSNGCGDDTCSPFCVCSCCSIVINSPEENQFNLLLLLPPFKELPSCVRNEFSFDFISTVWQPPTFS